MLWLFFGEVMQMRTEFRNSVEIEPSGICRRYRAAATTWVEGWGGEFPAAGMSFGCSRQAGGRSWGEGVLIDEEEGGRMREGEGY
jgi:hypothetical protein